MRIEAFIHGIYPRSEQLIASGRGLDRGRISPLDHHSQEERDFTGIVKLQRENSFSYIEDGKIRWHDFFRPLIEASNGFEVGPLTRWFDTNTFYRQPIIVGHPKLNIEHFDEYVPHIADARQKVTLPSPLTFAKLCHDMTTESFDKTLGGITEFLGSAVSRLGERGIRAVQFNEPYLAHSGCSRDDIDHLVTALASIDRSRIETLIIHFYFGDGSAALKTLEERETNIDVVGIDFYKTKVSDVPTGLSRPLVAGVINSQNTLLERKSDIEQFVDALSEHTRPGILYLSHTSDLEFLPQEIANEKVALLGELQQ